MRRQTVRTHGRITNAIDDDYNNDDDDDDDDDDEGAVSYSRCRGR